MFEDLFEFSNNLIPEEESSSGMITFEEYLNSKKPETDDLKISFDSFVSDGNPIEESVGMMTFIEYLESKNILVSDEDNIEEIINEPTQPKELHTKKSLWDGYVQHVKTSTKKPAIVNIQDPAYLDESRSRYAEFLIEEQKKVWDKIYFFTPGGRALDEEPESECAVIGKAVIGKNKIC